MSVYCYGGFKDCEPLNPEQIKKAHTRQLLKELRSTYSWGCPHCWEECEWNQLRCYRQELKEELATREHIPNKKESKAIRKARLKKGK